jgi:hypothetical protein
MFVSSDIKRYFLIFPLVRTSSRLRENGCIISDENIRDISWRLLYLLEKIMKQFNLLFNDLRFTCHRNCPERSGQMQPLVELSRFAAEF